MPGLIVEYENPIWSLPHHLWGKQSLVLFLKKTLWHLSMDVIQLPKATEPL